MKSYTRKLADHEAAMTICDDGKDCLTSSTLSLLEQLKIESEFSPLQQSQKRVEAIFRRLDLELRTKSLLKAKRLSQNHYDFKTNNMRGEN